MTQADFGNEDKSGKKDDVVKENCKRKRKYVKWEDYADANGMLAKLLKGNYKFEFKSTVFKKIQPNLSDEEITRLYPISVKIYGIDYIRDLLSIDEKDLQQKEDAKSQPLQGILLHRQYKKKMAKMKEAYRRQLITVSCNNFGRFLKETASIIRYFGILNVIAGQAEIFAAALVALKHFVAVTWKFLTIN